MSISLAPAARAIAKWIAPEPSSDPDTLQECRQRFEQYFEWALHPGELQRILMAAAIAAMPATIPPDLVEALTGDTEHADKLRGQLYFEVIGDLVTRGVQLAVDATPAKIQRKDEDEQS